MATTIERNAEKAKADFNHKVALLSGDVDTYVNKYNWRGKDQESAAGEWDNIQASMLAVKAALKELERSLKLAHDSVNGRFMLSAADNYSNKDVLDIN